MSDSCSKCARKFGPDEEILEALGKDFCESCFVCEACGGSLDGGMRKGPGGGPCCLACADGGASAEVSVDALEQALAAAQQRIVVLEKEAAAKGAAEARVAELEAAVAQNEQAANAAHARELEAAAAKLAAAEAELADKAARLAVLEGAAARAESELARVTARVAELEAAAGAGASSAELEQALAAAAAAEARAAQLESTAGNQDTYLANLEQELSEKKVQLLEAREAHEEFQKESAAAMEKAARVDELETRQAQMEAFIQELETERNGLAEKLDVAEKQVQALGAMLGKGGGVAAADAKPEESERLKEQIRALEAQLARRNEELDRQTNALATLRATSERAAQMRTNALAAQSNSAMQKKKSTTFRMGAAGMADEFEIVPLDATLAETFANLNLKRVEVSKERAGMADKKAWKDPQTEIVAKGGQVLFAKLEGAIVGTVALVATGDALELRYMSIIQGTDILGPMHALISAAAEEAKERKLTKLLVLQAGKLEDAQKSWGRHQFKNTGVGPAPEFAIKLERAL